MSFPGFSELRRNMCLTCEGAGEIPLAYRRVTCNMCGGTGRRR